jgi:putative intracellular protease/amidase
MLRVCLLGAGFWGDLEESLLSLVREMEGKKEGVSLICTLSAILPRKDFIR